VRTQKLITAAPKWLQPSLSASSTFCVDRVLAMGPSSFFLCCSSQIYDVVTAKTNPLAAHRKPVRPMRYVYHRWRRQQTSTREGWKVSTPGQLLEAREKEDSEEGVDE